MTDWEVTVNGVLYRIRASNSWTAATRGIKQYLRLRMPSSMNRATIRLEKVSS